MADQETRAPFLIAAKILFFILLQCFPGDASVGDRDPAYSSCLQSCEKTGCIADACFPPCSAELEQPLPLKLTRWDCPSECRYQCMVSRESERASAGLQPVKYHGKWPFQRLFGVQEPASALFSALNLLAHIWGLTSFLRFVHWQLPQGKRGSYYDYIGLWTIYGLFSVNAWIASVVFHARDTAMTESWDYSSAIASLGYSLILAIIRTFSIRTEATRVMVAAPFIGFIATHICFLNFYQFDYGWNMSVCVAMGLTQLLLWLIWASVSRHASSWKVWTVGLGTLVAMLLELFDFPPWMGYVDAHSLWHLMTVPLTCLWWSFVRDDADATAARLLKGIRGVKKAD